MSTYRELELSRDAQVFHLRSDRLVLDPEMMCDKVRVRLDRRTNATGALRPRVDEYRALDLAAVMEDVPPGFTVVVDHAIRLFRSEAFKSRRRAVASARALENPEGVA